MESKGTLEPNSGYKGTSYKKLHDRSKEMIEIWDLKNFDVDQYKVQICLEQDFDEIDKHFEYKNNADQLDKDNIRDYRYYDYSEVPEEEKQKVGKKPATGGYGGNGLGWGNCVKCPLITEEFVMTYDFGDKSKPIMVFIHGWMGSTMSFFKTFNFLENDFHGISIDLIGFGTSSRPNFLAKNSHQAEEYFLQLFEKWRAKMDISKFFIVGHSLGGFIATKYTLRYPQHVKKLALWSPLGIEPIPKVPRKYFKKQMKYLGGFKCFIWGGFTNGSKVGFNIINVMRFFGGGMVKCIMSKGLLKFVGPMNNRQLKAYVSYAKQNLLSKESSERGIPYLMRNYIMPPNPILHDLDTLKELKIDVCFAYGEFGLDFLNTDFELEGKSISKKLKELGYVGDEYTDAGHNLQMYAPKPLSDRLIEFFLERDDVQNFYDSRT